MLTSLEHYHILSFQTLPGAQNWCGEYTLHCANRQILHNPKVMLRLMAKSDELAEIFLFVILFPTVPSMGFAHSPANCLRCGQAH